MAHTHRPNEISQESPEKWADALTRVCLSIHQWIQHHPGTYLHKIQNVWETLSPAEKIAFMNDKTFLSEAGKKSLPIYNILAAHNSIKNALHVRQSATADLTMNHVEPIHIKLFASLGIFDCPKNALFLEDEIPNLKQILTLLGTLSAFIPGLGAEIKALITQVTRQAENLAMTAKTVFPKIRENVQNAAKPQSTKATQQIQEGIQAQVRKAS